MHIDWWTLAFQTINVLVLVWLLARFLYKPVLKMVADRQQAAAALLDQAQAAKTAADAQEAALKAQNDALAADAERRRTDMRAAIDAERQHLLDQARGEANALAKQAGAAADAERSRMTAELQEKARILAGDMAEKLLRRLPAGGTIDPMFDALIGHVATLPDADRKRLATDAPLVLVTPVPIDADAAARYADRLAATLPGLVRPDFAVDPALIAGFELRGPHMLVRNSWRADLDALLADLKEDDHGGRG